MESTTKQGPSTARALDLGGGVGAVITVHGEHTAGRLAVVEHPFEPGGLIEPHTHALEDEWTYVLAGRVAVQVGGDIRELEAGGHIFKPRAVEHAVWNPTPERALLLEVIVPAGFERFFEEATALVAPDGTFDGDAFVELAERYAVSMAFDKAPALIAERGLDRLRTDGSS